MRLVSILIFFLFVFTSLFVLVAHHSFFYSIYIRWRALHKLRTKSLHFVHKVFVVELLTGLYLGELLLLLLDKMYSDSLLFLSFLALFGLHLGSFLQQLFLTLLTFVINLLTLLKVWVESFQSYLGFLLLDHLLRMCIVPHKNTLALIKVISIGIGLPGLLIELLGWERILVPRAEHLRRVVLLHSLFLAHLGWRTI